MKKGVGRIADYRNYRGIIFIDVAAKKCTAILVKRF